MTALFSVEDLTVEYATHSGPLKALDRVSFSVDAGETLAAPVNLELVVGEMFGFTTMPPLTPTGAR